MDDAPTAQLAARVAITCEKSPLRSPIQIIATAAAKMPATFRSRPGPTVHGNTHRNGRTVQPEKSQKSKASFWRNTIGSMDRGSPPPTTLDGQAGRGLQDNSLPSSEQTRQQFAQQLLDRSGIHQGVANIQHPDCFSSGLVRNGFHRTPVSGKMIANNARRRRWTSGKIRGPSRCAVF